MFAAKIVIWHSKLPKLMPLLTIDQPTVMPELPAGHLFNSPAFGALQEGAIWRFVLHEAGNPLARIWFAINDQTAVSGAGATFGSVDFARQADEPALLQFLSGVLDRLQQQAIRRVVIRHYPFYYAHTDAADRAIRSLGFRQEVEETDQYLEVDGVAFTDKLRANERKKLRQCYEAGYTFRQLPAAALAEVYRLVVATRQRRSYPVSMSLAALRAAQTAMPDKYLLFGVFDGGKLIAASVSIRVSRQVLYNFYHADEAAYRNRSPLVRLVEGVYQYCRFQHIDYLDLGISSVEGQLNEGLYRFKKNLGCLEAPKITYSLTL